MGIKVINGTDAEILINEVQQVTMGHGADSVIITAKTDKNNVIKNSANISKKKGKVVLIGEVGLNLDRSDFYEKRNIISSFIFIWDQLGGTIQVMKEIILIILIHM